MIRRAIRAVRSWEWRTRPVDPRFVEALARRWEQLPEHIRTRGQFLGRGITGCEGTHGVFPRCNLRCTPCYHSRDANQVRVDGRHTVEQIGAQMQLMREQRGPSSHAQLIGGEVSLLSPDEHAEALAVMREHGREPMSFTHGDFDYDYLSALAVDAHGRRRSRRLSFAAHFDMMMFGRRGIEHPADERSLNPYRARFVEMFARLRREHGVESFLAHNMTVTPTNLDQVAEVIKDCHGMGYGMFSFQPAAFVGDQRRWRESYQRLGRGDLGGAAGHGRFVMVSRRPCGGSAACQVSLVISARRWCNPAGRGDGVQGAHAFQVSTRLSGRGRTCLELGLA